MWAPKVITGPSNGAANLLSYGVARLKSWRPLTRTRCRRSSTIPLRVRRCQQWRLSIAIVHRRHWEHARRPGICAGEFAQDFHPDQIMCGEESERGEIAPVLDAKPRASHSRYMGGREGGRGSRAPSAFIIAEDWGPLNLRHMTCSDGYRPSEIQPTHHHAASHKFCKFEGRPFDKPRWCKSRPLLFNPRRFAGA